MRNDGYNDGGPEPLKPKGRNYTLACELLSELDCECEPSESTCGRCAALGGLEGEERESARRISQIERELSRERVAVDACNAYWMACAAAWARNNGRVGVATTGGAVVVGDDLDTLADEAARLVAHAIDSRLSEPKS